MRLADFDAMKLMEDARVAGEAFGFDEAEFDEGHRAAGDRIMWWTSGAVGTLLVAVLFVM